MGNSRSKDPVTLRDCALALVSVVQVQAHVRMHFITNAS
jgi:hypothetical protein